MPIRLRRPVAALDERRPVSGFGFGFVGAMFRGVRFRAGVRRMP
jgi:hypothetical protein